MTYATAREALTDLIRYVPNFPVQGVIFEDLTPALANAECFRMIVDRMAEAAIKYGADLIGGLDARGFLLGSAAAYKMGLGILAIRKQGKLPPPVYRQDFVLEYGEAAFEIPAQGIDLDGRKVVLIDDVLATGGTLLAARNLLERFGATITGNVVVLEVKGLGGREQLADLPLTVINEN